VSSLLHALCACVLLAAAVPKATGPPAQSAASQTSAAPAPNEAPGPREATLDPVLKALRAEVERLQQEAQTAAAAAGDETARTQIRLQLITDLLLLLIRQQEQLYLQNQALLAALSTPKAGGAAVASSAPAAKASPGSGKPAGAVFAKRGGDSKAHRPGCPFGERIAAGARVTYASLAQAVAAGYQPCKVCRPDR